MKKSRYGYLSNSSSLSFSSKKKSRVAPILIVVLAVLTFVSAGFLIYFTEQEKTEFLMVLASATSFLGGLSVAISITQLFRKKSPFVGYLLGLILVFLPFMTGLLKLISLLLK